MHLKLLFILTGALGVSWSSCAQGGFSKLYIEGLGTNSILYDHPYILTAAQIANTNGDRGLLFMKMNNAGVIIDTTAFFDDNRTIYSGFQNCFIKTDDGYVLAGRRTPEAMLLKLDTNLKVKDTAFFQFSGEWTSALSIAEAANNDLLVAGTVYWIDTVRQERRKGFLAARFDAQLNLKWIKRFHTPSVNGKTVEQQAHNIMEDHQGNIWMGGYRQAISGDNVSDVLVMALDSLGNKFFEQTYGDTTLDEGIATVLEAPDSNYFVVATLGINVANVIGEIGARAKIRVLKIDSSGTILWDKVFGPLRVSTYVSNAEIQKGGIVASGYYLDLDIDYTQRDALFRSYIFKVDFNGDSLWFREYIAGTLHNDWNRLFDIAATPDGGLVAGGHFLSNTSSPLTGQPGSHVWILRTDSTGCVVQGCQYISTEEPIELAGITVYPNPAQSHITLSLLPTSEPVDLSIYNTQGQIVKQCMNTHANDQVLINDLTKGLYLVQFSREGQTLGEERLLIE